MTTKTSSLSNYGSTKNTGGGDDELLKKTKKMTNGDRNDESSHLLIDKESSLSKNDCCSWWDRLVFGWIHGLLELANDKKQLQPADLQKECPLPRVCQTRPILQIFTHHYYQQSSSTTSEKETSLIWALISGFGYDFYVAAALKLLHDSCQFVGPLVLNGLVQYLRNPDAPLWHGAGLTLAVTLSQLTMSLALRHYFFKCYLVGLRIRAALIMVIYQKALVLDTQHYQQQQQQQDDTGKNKNKKKKSSPLHSLGQLTNLISIDAQRIGDLTSSLNAVWYSFFQIGVAFYFLWRQLGPSCFGGIFVILLAMPLTRILAQWLGTLQRRLLQARDERIGVNTELLTNMACVKYQAWERFYRDAVYDKRRVEWQKLWTATLGRAVSIVVWAATPLCVALATFGAHVLIFHQRLEVASALTSLALFDILRFPLFMLPQIVNSLVDASVSLERVHSFLQAKEYQPVGQGNLKEDGTVSMNKASFIYETIVSAIKQQDDNEMTNMTDKEKETVLKARLQHAQDNLKDILENKQQNEDTEEQVSQQQPPCLDQIDFSCNQGQFIAIVGAVGSGKSSLFRALLGEIRQQSGTTAKKGRVGYFCQTPFILNDTLRNNVLFRHAQHDHFGYNTNNDDDDDDETVDETLYQKAIECCALSHDIGLLPGGDETEIGEKGITLSGGQKARIALARIVYDAADIILLDDPLAAVDAHVGQHLFDECIVQQLLLNGGGDNKKKRSVILITNALQYLNHDMVDKIVVLEHGQVVQQGTYNELMQQPDSLFGRFVKVISESTPSNNNDDKDKKQKKKPESKNNDTTKQKANDTMTKRKPNGNQQENGNDAKNGTLMTDEFKERETGHIDFKVFLAWGRAGGGVWVPFAIFIAYGLVEAVNVATKWWLAHWSAEANADNQVAFLTGYAYINLAAVAAVFCRLLLLTYCGLEAAKVLFQRLLDVVLMAPMSFFDTTPIGRIMNRFSKDVYTVDEQLVASLRMYLATLFTVGSTVIVISGVTPLFTLCLVPMVAFYIMQYGYFTMAYRELKRLDSIGRSPIYALLGETLDGVSTIRAFGAQGSLVHRLENMLDRQQHAFYLTFASQCWLAVRLELVGTLIITFACLCSVLEHGRMAGNETFAGLAGLSISFALSVTQSLNWSVRTGSEFEANMVAVERMEQYSTGLPSEAPHYTAYDESLSSDWPPKGRVEFIGAQLRYRPGLPLVLKGLNLAIPGGSKVGIVGRTGAGKSTLMVALLRLVELDSGKILIDGVDHRNLGLATLRSKIAVIPQDPTLFSGTVRSNLDPFEQHADENLISVLSRVGLYDTAKAPIESLSDPVLESGSNFSVGQRQLLVIARALLCGATIVIMDEATAAVDADTDARIQKVMRTEFQNATCLTVAHRINTIMDSNYILVMDDGKAAEFDTPHALLNKTDGMFASLVRAAAQEE